MRKNLQNKTKSIIPFLALVVLSFILISKVFFIHTHHSSDGQIVVHAHPFQKKSESQGKTPHQHSDNDLKYITDFNHFDNSTTSDFHFELIASNYSFIINNDQKHTFLGVFYTNGRAPPSLA